jgi:hypothetical protein
MRRARLPASQTIRRERRPETAPPSSSIPRSGSGTPEGAARATEDYVERIFGPGSGRKHVRFLERIASDSLRGLVHGYHVLEADTRFISLEENYLIGMCVLLSTRGHTTAAMFAKTLLHLGTPKEKLLEATTRLAMWIGGLPAVEAAFVVQAAIREYERDGVKSLSAWFPEDGEP